MSINKTPKAALIIIGNEILSGRTLDKNTQHIALELGKKGITLSEVRIIPDVKDTIITTARVISDSYDYVFTTGGLGPTHDDITVDCIAEAFGEKVEVNSEAYARLEAHYGAENFTTARQRMARIPTNAALIDNPVSTAPGFTIKNVHCMAGVPRIMQAMLDNVLKTLEGGAVTISRTISCTLPESQIAAILSTLQDANPDIDIGSYPFFANDGVGVSVVLRGTDANKLELLRADLHKRLDKMDANPRNTD